MYVKSFKELIVWQKSVALVKEIYKITSKFPATEIYGLSNQMRRSAVSIPSNIAEGKSRKTTKDFLNFLRIAAGSAAELETQIFIGKDLYAGSDCQNAENLLEEVQKMLNVMIQRLEAKS